MRKMFVSIDEIFEEKIETEVIMAIDMLSNGNLKMKSKDIFLLYYGEHILFECKMKILKIKEEAKSKENKIIFY
jgi:hypothetical protein